MTHIVISWQKIAKTDDKYSKLIYFQIFFGWNMSENKSEDTVPSLSKEV